ncbi:FYVE, RhoGEF and PH domain-containing protein 6-like [Limulus polyphemus]|uniref:FYVE, RhoGEF and PH domain-containing protein 6-like n=1 Tax=Limulus polyphemus TaxID=6850 RepID=A0ABM1B2D8_LIMPO|nr:FYVE, RhoGEF and PH domain-containing protein 6-like [Limulus polyphemus]
MSLCRPVTKLEFRQRASPPLLSRSERSVDSLSNNQEYEDQKDIRRVKERISKSEDKFERRLTATEKIKYVEKKDQSVQTSEPDSLQVNKQWKNYENKQTIKSSPTPTLENEALKSFQDLHKNKYLSNERKKHDKTASSIEQPAPPTRSKRTRSQADTNVSPVRRDIEKSPYHKFSSDDCRVKETKADQKKHVLQVLHQKSHHSKPLHQRETDIPPPLPPKLYPKVSLSKTSKNTPPEVPERTYKNIIDITDIKTTSHSPSYVSDRGMVETVQSVSGFPSRSLLTDVPSDYSLLMRRHNIKQHYFDRPIVGTSRDDVPVKHRNKGAPVHESVYSRHVSDIRSRGSKFEPRERKKYENIIYGDKTSTPTRNYKRRTLKSSSPEHRQRVNSDSRTTREEASWFDNNSLYVDFERSFSCPEQEPFLEYRRQNTSSGKVKGDHSVLSTSRSKQPWPESKKVKHYQKSNREQTLQKEFFDWSELQSDERANLGRSGKYSDTTVEHLKKKLSNLSESEDTDELLNLRKNTVDELKISLDDSYTMEDIITTENEKQSTTERQEPQTTEGTVSGTKKEDTKTLEGFGELGSSASMFCSHSSTSFFDSSDESYDEVDGEEVDEKEKEKIKREKKLYRIAEELVTTEEKFVSSLRLLNEEFRKYVNKANKMNDTPIIPDETLNQIFRHLPELQRLNENFLQELQTRLKEWSENRRIADLIIQHGPFLKLYSAYICDFRNMSTVLEESKRKYPMFQELVREFEALSLCKSLSLEHYMLKPIQRIPQYRLFLERYMKYLPNDSTEYDDTGRALDIMTKVTEHANEFMKRGDNFAKLLSIQNSIFGNFEIVKPGRIFIKEGELLKLSRKEMQPRWFILFNDCLVSTTPIQRYLYVIHHKLPLTGMKVSIPEQPGYQNEFSIITVQRSYTIVARSPEIREDWIKALSKAITENATKRRSFLLVKDDDDDMEDEAESHLKIGNKAPVWVPDKRVSMCQICTRDFKVTYRRHHCRGCGKVVCSACSANRYPLNYLHNRMARVCEKCLVVLQQESSQEHLSRPSVTEKLEVSPSFGSSEVDSDCPLMNSKKHVRNRPCVLKEVPASDKDITKKGYLYRMRQNKSWKKYWFLIKDKVLYMYRACEDVAALTSRPLLGYSVERLTKLPENEEDAGCFFQLTHKGQLPVIFRAENPQEADSWMSTMRKATVIE